MADDTEKQPPAGDQPGAEGTQAPAKAAVSIRQRLAQLVAGEEAASELADVRAQLTAVTGERDQLLESVKGLNEKVAALQNEVGKLKADLADAEQAVADFEKNVQAAAEAKAKKLTIEQVAAAGIPAEELPAASGAGEDKEAKLRAELAETTDPRRKGVIAKQLLDLRKWEN